MGNKTTTQMLLRQQLPRLRRAVSLTPQICSFASMKSRSAEELASQLDDLYTLKYSDKTVDEIYTDDADFEDRISHAKGKRSIAGHFKSLPTLFEEATNASSQGLNKDNWPEKLIISKEMKYKFKTFHSEKTLPFEIHLWMDEECKVKKHEAHWYGEELEKEGVKGTAAEFFKSLTSGVADMIWKPKKKDFQKSKL